MVYRAQAGLWLGFEILSVEEEDSFAMRLEHARLTNFWKRDAERKSEWVSGTGRKPTFQPHFMGLTP
jgi:hypothetical protein